MKFTYFIDVSPFHSENNAYLPMVTSSPGSLPEGARRFKFTVDVGEPFATVLPDVVAEENPR